MSSRLYRCQVMAGIAAKGELWAQGIWKELSKQLPVQMTSRLRHCCREAARLTAVNRVSAGKTCRQSHRLTSCRSSGFRRVGMLDILLRTRMLLGAEEMGAEMG